MACQAALLSVAILFAPSSLAFAPTSLGVTQNFQAASSVAHRDCVFGPRYCSNSLTSLKASGGGKKRKKRRRKVPIEETENAAPSPQSVAASVPGPVKTAPAKIESVDNMIGEVEELDEATEEDIFTLKDVAKFAFDEDRAASMGKTKMMIQGTEN